MNRLIPRTKVVTCNYKNYKLPLLSFGAASFPTLESDKTYTDEKKAQEIINYALKNGINYFDAGWQYHYGKSEETLAKALSSYSRDSYYLADKLPIWLVKNENDVEYYISEQLKRCNVDYFDFYLVHSINEKHFEKLKELNIYEKLLELKNRGIIKNLGFSFAGTPSLLEKVLDSYKWDFTMLQLNYIDWKYCSAKDLYSVARNNDIPIMVMQPLRKGILAQNKKTTEFSLRFVASLEGVITVVCGTKEICHLKENVEVFKKQRPLSNNELNVLNTEIEKIFLKTTKLCNGCSKCVEICPQNIKIPGILLTVKQFLNLRDEYFYIDTYSSIDPKYRCEQCANCQECIKVCDRGVNISLVMQMIQKNNND